MKRDVRIDVLRSLGIMLIMLAHVSPPKEVAATRIFDVPLMTFLMGMGMLITSKKTENYLPYVWKRFKRLMLPSFIFLTIFFIVFNIINIFSSTPFPFTIKTYLGSYSTFAGIGYIWIIRVFFIMSILSPIFLYINKKLEKTYLKLLFLTLCLLIQEISSIWIKDQSGPVNFLISNLIIMSFGYAIVTQFGMWTMEQSKKENKIFIAYFLIIFAIFLSKYNFMEINLFKYPPFPFYLVYGMLVSSLLWFLVSIQPVRSTLEKYTVIKWFSINSLTIYYWHIIPVFYIENYVEKNSIIQNWLVMYIVVIAIAVIGTILQNKVINSIKNIQST